WRTESLRKVSIEAAPTTTHLMRCPAEAQEIANATDHYRLEITATDPEYQGTGFCSLLAKEGLEKCQSKPVTLEATTTHSRDIYAHLGFEVSAACIRL
ncbi:hypothetical protein GGX14DRAFT_355217, partial [Mycena pura]